jgi:hypothetical protein
MAPTHAMPTAEESWAMIARDNRRRAVPYPTCRDCDRPYHPSDGAVYYRGRLCEICEAQRIDRLLYRAARRLGRRKYLISASNT